MPRGQPDYGNPQLTFSTTVNNDLDLLAIEAGVARIDNRGRIIWYDDFRGGLSRWAIYGDGGGAFPVRNIEDGKGFGHYGSVKLDPVLTSGESYIEMNSVVPISAKMGIEVSILPVWSFGLFNLNLYGWFGGASGKYMNFSMEATTGDIKISHAGGSATVADISSPSLIIGRWNTIKIVGNYQTGQYERLFYGNTQYDISAYAMADVSNAIGGSIGAVISTLGLSGAYIEPVYLGHVVISGDEP